MLKIEKTWSKYMLNCPYPRPNLQILGPRPDDGQGSSCSPASCMTCCTDGLCPSRTQFFFSERAARSLPQNLLEEKDLTHFLGKKQHQRRSGLCDLKRMF
jgi:hypothetical protein